MKYRNLILKTAASIVTLLSLLPKNAFPDDITPVWSGNNVTYPTISNFNDLIPAGEYEYCRWGLHIDYISDASGDEDFTANALTTGSSWTAQEQDGVARGHLFLQRINPDSGLRERTLFQEVSATFTPDGDGGRNCNFNVSGLNNSQFPEQDFRAMRYFHFEDDSLQNLDSSTKKIIVLIHGWNPDSNANAYNEGNFQILANNLRRAPSVENRWTVANYRMERDTDTGPSGAGQGTANARHGSRAAEIARLHGYHLAQEIIRRVGSPEKVQLIAHSAGSWAARSAIRYLLENSTATVQLTLLDPYIPGVNNPITDNSNLDTGEMSEVDEFPGNGNIYRLENYYSDDAFVGGTQEVFQWGTTQNDSQQHEIDVFGNPLDWRGHGGPITFYGDTVADSTSDRGLGGWRLSMAFEELNSGPPEAPSPILPIDEALLTGAEVTIDWSDEDATNYFLEVQATPIAGGAFGSVFYDYVGPVSQKTIPLTGGYLYYWRVWAQNSAGFSAASPYQSFSKELAPPGPVTQNEPAGTITERRPQFSWQQTDPASTWFRIYITRNGVVVRDEWIQSETTWTPTQDLVAGNYSWWILPYNPDGYGVWSDGSAFTIEAHVPDQITLLSPKDETVPAGEVSYLFVPVPDTQWYQVAILQDGVVVYNQWHNIVANSSTPENIPLSVTRGGTNCQWWVRAWNVDGYGPWSDPADFSVQGLLPPILLSPTGTISEGNPTYNWETVAGAEWYNIYSTWNGHPYINKWVQADTFYQASEFHGNGEFEWWARTWNSSQGYGPWSTSLNFSVGNGGFLVQGSLSWQAEPSDLDLHLRTPTGAHVFYGDPGSADSAPFAELDLDHVDGFGPENISVYQNFPGTYIVYAHRFGGNGELAGSQAKFRLFDSEGQIIMQLTAPQSGSGDYWYIGDFDGTTLEFTERNQIQTDEP